MPELPDVEIFRRLAERHGVGRTVERAVVADPASLEGATVAALQRRLKGQRLVSCRRHGKHLFLDAGGGGTLAMHFGTNGSLQAVPRGAPPPSYVRLLFELSDGNGLAYVNPRRIGRVRLVDSAESFIAEQRLGPDALDAAFDASAFSSALDGCRQGIKAALMDQSRMAGIGNIYADEILFHAGLHPAIPAGALDGKARLRLFNAMRQVLRTAIDCGAGAENFTDRLPKGYLLPQRHPGGHCPRCGVPLVVGGHGGRTFYHCPRCQPEPRAKSA